MAPVMSREKSLYDVSAYLGGIQLSSTKGGCIRQRRGNRMVFRGQGRGVKDRW